MSYIGVSPENQEFFRNRVAEAQNKFYDYSPPTTKEAYWATVDYYWPEIKNIVLMLIIGQVIVYIIHSIVKILKMCFLKVTLKK